MFDYLENGDVQAANIVNPLNDNAPKEEQGNANRFIELQNAIEIYQNDHDVLTVEQNAIAQRIESKEKEIVEKQKELAVLIDQQNNGKKCIVRAEKKLHELSRTRDIERQFL